MIFLNVKKFSMCMWFYTVVSVLSDIFLPEAKFLTSAIYWYSQLLKKKIVN